MAEVLIIGAIIGTGYLLNKNGVNREQLRNIDLDVPACDIPNGRNIYHSDESVKRRQDEWNHAKKLYKKQDVIFSGPPTDPNTLLNKTDYADKKLPIEFTGGNNGIEDTTDNFCGYSLTGDYINPATFQHNNMVPFFGSQVKQNVDEHATKNILETFTGTWSDYKEKTAVPYMFDVEKEVGNVHGNNNFQDINITDQDRYYVSNKRNNEVPIEKVYVGPGLNQGYTAEPTGGFQQANVRDYAIPKRTNELRTKNNPKLTFEGRVLPGAGIARTGKVGELAKNRPDRYYNNSANRYFTTMGAFSKDRYRSDIRINNNNRNINSKNKHIGPAGPATYKQIKVRSKHKPPTKQQLSNYGIRNAGNNAWNINNKNAPNDYGKKNLHLKRTIKETHIKKGNRLGNVESGVVKKSNLPFNPIKVKKTRKQNTIGNPNTLGYMKPQEHGQSYTYNPNHVARTTLKEQNIHDNNGGYMKPQGHGKSYTYDPDDVAKTTLKEQNIHDNNGGYMKPQGHGKSYTYDPNDVAKTTLKEQNIHDNNNGYMNPQEHGQSYTYDPNDVAKTTLKEQNIHDGRVGNINRADMTKSIVYDPDDICPTTNKEVSMMENVYGNIDSQRTGDGYKNASVNIDPTIRQFTSREQTNNANLNTNGGYMIANKQTIMEPTLRETVADIEYTGGAGNGGEIQPMSYSDIYNSTISSLREEVSQGRVPTRSGTKQNVSGSSVNMNTTRTTSANNQHLQDRGTTYGSQNTTTPTFGLMGDVQLSDNKNVNFAQDRDNDVFTSQLQSNPYIQNINNQMFEYNPNK
jgi:hypothetical protein